MTTIPSDDPDGRPAGGVTDWLLNHQTQAQTDPSGTATPPPQVSSNLHDWNSEQGDATQNVRNGVPQQSLRSFFADMPQAEGLNLGHFDIEQVLGRGGFGVVLKAFDRKLQRTVAIKMMNTEMAATSPARKRFLREARAAAAVRHENVVQIYTVEEEPLPYLVMEYIPGESLQQRLDRNGPLGVGEILRIGAQIARGLAAAHETNLVHRDIKPANILLKANSEMPVRLTDFGLARAADDASLTQSGIVAGTPMFMAPEQAAAESFDHRADLFSLGSVLYVMACGRPPFRAQSTVAVLKRVVEDTPRPIREIIPEVPAWLCDIIAKLHAKDPNDRYQTAKEVADVLADCQYQHQAHGTLKDLSRIPKSIAVASTIEKRAMKTRWIPASVGVGLLVMLIVIAFTRDYTPPADAGFTGHHTVNEAKPADANRFVNVIGMEFVLVPPGTAWLGGGGGTPGKDEFTQSSEYFLGKFEVTQDEWQRVMNKNPSHFSRTGERADEVKGISDDELKRLPVDSISWYDCQEFLAKLNERCHEEGWVYRLPSSQEWEYACRGGPMTSTAESAFHFYFDTPSNDLIVGKWNCKDLSIGRTSRVGSYPANKLGLHDMHGNVFEYCNDLKSDDEGKPLRILRGGTWHDPLDFARAGNNSVGHPRGAFEGGGLRILRERIK